MPRIGHLNPPSLFTYRKADAFCVSCTSSPEFAPKDLFFFLLGSLGSCIPIACSGVESSTQTLLLECWILLMMMMNEDKIVVPNDR
jgi:hypothetical protein